MNNVPSPDNSDSGIEREILAKGKTAPRITPADIEANIDSEHYFTAGEGSLGAAFANSRITDSTTFGYQCPPSLELLTFCVLVLRNGYTVTGESACASPENFDPEIGRRIARENAVQKCWSLLGYELKERLYQRTQPAQVPTPACYSGVPGDRVNASGAS